MCMIDLGYYDSCTANPKHIFELPGSQYCDERNDPGHQPSYITVPQGYGPCPTCEAN
jgi:hypothetical protein